MMESQESLMSFGLKQPVFWLYNARYQAYKQSLLPTLIAVLYSARFPGFSPGLALLAVLGVFLAHMSANLLDDYFDYRSESVKSRQEMIDGGIRARGRKCAYILSGATTARTTLLIGLFLGACASVCGIIIICYRGMEIIVPFAMGAILALFYSAPPLRLSYRGLGEAVAFLLFGPVLVYGVAVASAGECDFPLLLVACSMGLLVTNVLYTHSVLDFAPDQRAGKVTFAGLLGNQRRAVTFSAILLVSVYLPILIGVAIKALPVGSLLVFLSLPRAIALWYLLDLHLRHPDRIVPRTWWMGQMEQWSHIQRAGIEWFMIRWYLSRNLLVAFAVLLALGWLIGG